MNSTAGASKTMVEDTRSTQRLSVNAEAVAAAAERLRNGGLVAFPTETVYGLGADASNAVAVAGIYAAKGRPSFNPLIAHIASFEAAEAEGRFGPEARALAKAFWPGPLTLVVPVASGGTVCDLARAGLDSVGLRIPSHPTARALIAAAGRPIAAPSANRSGRVSPVTADHVAGDLAGRIDMILDDGPCPVGLESTIVSCLDDGPRLLRPGGIPREAIERVIGHPLAEGATTAAAPLAPGMLSSHYAPAAHVRLNAMSLKGGEVGLDFGGKLAGASVDLSPSGNLAEAAAQLFSALRELDATGAEGIAVAPIPREGLGEAINDRLERAAAPRG
jgi:L-threonylcarbamoyladenylate synthase